MMVDAENKILGRMTSQVASKVENGEEISIVNSEKAIITGSPEQIKSKYRHKQNSGGKYTGPFQPADPGRIVGDALESMLPDNTDIEIRTYIGDPLNEEPDQISAKEADPERRGKTPIEEISRSLGWSPK